METKIVKIDVPELSTIEKSKAQQIKETFGPMVKMLESFEKSFSEILTESKKKITNDLTAKAKRLRIDISKVRIQTGKLKDEGKAEYLRAERAIQAVHNIIVWAVTDKENKLKEIEDYFEIQEKKRLEKLQLDRAEKLSKYVEDAFERDLSNMDEDVWKAYYSTKKKEYEDRIEAEKKAEEERIEKERIEKLHDERIGSIRSLWQFMDDSQSGINLGELTEEKWNDLISSLNQKKSEYDAEQERIRKENDRLAREAEKKQKELEAEREKTRKEQEAKDKQISEERARAQKEKEEREKLEAKIKAEKDAEEKARQDAERKRKAEEKAARLAPDKTKLMNFCQAINDLPRPEVKSIEAADIASKANILLSKTVNFIKENADKL